MILIGQFDSPFVRRVGIALRWYGVAFEHRAHAVFRDEALIAEFNPLRKVPTLVLDDGTVLTESFVCIEHIDERVAGKYGQEWDRMLLPRRGPERLEGLRLCGFAVGVMDKLVTLIYGRHVSGSGDPEWVQRCTRQVHETLGYLEGIRAGRSTAFLTGEQIGHADIAVSCAMTLAGEAIPDVLAGIALPGLRELTDRCEAMPAFRQSHQPFVINK